MNVLIAVTLILLVFFYWRPTVVIAAVILMVLIGLGLHSVVDALPSGVTDRTFSITSEEGSSTP
jgi:membrane-bound metal-dependent hydrolase YbcI (DUF457 family)